MSEHEPALRRLRTRIASFSLPEMAVLYADRRATVRGCRRILTYSPAEIALAMRDRILCISGEDLRCVSFSGGCVTVEGKIASVTFPEAKDPC